ncbi:MAG: hypothetical protein JXR41_04680 [Bacteroidales bacterium]|nr:hypothetical protein [Bacteroidales bacterium]MBN2762366.1 hypothetical protein [Bacteroidales bacterium]
MKKAFRFIVLCLTAIMFNVCSDDPEDVTGSDDLSTDADITAEGGILKVKDKSGNEISLTIPPGAVLETTHITLTLSPEDKNLPIDVRNVAVFEIKPVDINLYVPAEITIKYNTTVSEIEKTALFRLRSDEWLTPLGDHTYSSDNQSMTATTLFFGDFAEGKMTLEQINTQLGLLKASSDMKWKSTSGSTENGQVYCDTQSHKATWDRYRDGIGSYLKYFKLLLLNGYYDESLFEADLAFLCEKIVSRGMQEVLDMCVPDNLCDRDYKHTIGTMYRDMTLLGCCDNEACASLEERFNQILINCGSYLIIDSQLVMDGAELVISTIGNVPLMMSTWSGNTAIVQGWGTCEVSGSGEYGVCMATVSGITNVDVHGNRDASGIYNLTIGTEQNATMLTQCGDLGAETPLVGGDTRQVSLGPDNEYTVDIQEAVQGGSYTATITLMNPWTDLPGNR